MRTKIVCLVFVCIAVTAAIRAEDRPTSLATAAAAVEANMKTREGKAYDEQIGREFLAKYPPVMKACKQRAGGDLRSFDMLVRVEKDGMVREVLLHPATGIAQCLRETLVKDTFSPPPKPAYWVDIHMALKP